MLVYMCRIYFFLNGRNIWVYILIIYFFRLPLPPGAFSTLWESEDRFRDTYYQTIPVCIIQ